MRTGLAEMKTGQEEMKIGRAKIKNETFPACLQQQLKTEIDGIKANQKNNHVKGRVDQIGES